MNQVLKPVQPQQVRNIPIRPTQVSTLPLTSNVDSQQIDISGILNMMLPFVMMAGMFGAMSKAVTSAKVE